MVSGWSATWGSADEVAGWRLEITTLVTSSDVTGRCRPSGRRSWSSPGARGLASIRIVSERRGGAGRSLERPMPIWGATPKGIRNLCQVRGYHPGRRPNLDPSDRSSAAGWSSHRRILRSLRMPRRGRTHSAGAPLPGSARTELGPGPHGESGRVGAPGRTRTTAGLRLRWPTHRRHRRRSGPRWRRASRRLRMGRTSHRCRRAPWPG